MNVLDLCVGEAKRLSVDEALDRVELIHKDEVGVGVVVVDGANILPEELIVQWVVTALLELDVLNAAANLEKILNDILALAGVLT